MDTKWSSGRTRYPKTNTEIFGALDQSNGQPQTFYRAFAGESLDFPVSVVEKVKQMWTAGCHIADIEAAVNCDQNLLAVLIIDLARKGKVDCRPGGVFGSREEEHESRTAV